jgi:uncharacterized protein involved in type VI secretion and phage assembly
MHSLHLAKVLDNADPDARGRVKVMMLATELEIWASAVVPSAGQGYGFSCLPKVDEVVVVAFITQDQALLLGSIWSGAESAPTDADPQEDHYLVQTPAGTIMEFDDSDGPKLEVRTSQGHSITVTDGNGGEIEIKRGGQSIKLTSSEINITSSATVKIQGGSMVEIEAGMVRVNASVTEFSGVVRAPTVIADAVVGTSYTPGAGNVW